MRSSISPEQCLNLPEPVSSPQAWCSPASAAAANARGDSTIPTTRPALSAGLAVFRFPRHAQWRKVRHAHFSNTAWDGAALGEGRLAAEGRACYSGRINVPCL